MKNLKILLILLILSIISACSPSSLPLSDSPFESTFYTNYESEDFDPDNIILSFAALSDIHIGGEGQKEKVDHALGLLMNKAKNPLDALLIAGDLTDTSGWDDSDSQVVVLRNILKKHLNEDISLVYCLGLAHDHMFENIQRDILRYRRVLGEEFHKNEIGKEEDYNMGQRHYLINGFHFLSLDYDEQIYSKERVQWLDDTLKELTEKEPNKPIFLTYHIPNMDAPYYIAAKYPQVILFTGHTHLPFNNDKSIRQTSFTHLHCGGMYYYRQFTREMQEVNNMGDLYDFAQAYLIEVDINNNVRAIRLDLNNDSFYEPEWIIPYPKDDLSHLKYKNLRLEASKPYFDVDEFSFNVEYDHVLQADFKKAISGNNPVEYYLLTNWQLIGDEILEEKKYISSQFALHEIDDHPDNMGFSFFPKSDHFAIAVTAFDCFNYSNSIVFSKGLYTVKIEIEDPRISFSLNSTNTIIKAYRPGDEVDLTVWVPDSYSYELTCYKMEINSNIFTMPEDNLTITVNMFFKE